MVLAVRYAPVRRALRLSGYRQFVVVASGLGCMAVLVAVVGEPGHGVGRHSAARGPLHRGRARRRRRVAGYRRLGGPRPSPAPALPRTERGRLGRPGGRPASLTGGPAALAAPVAGPGPPAPAGVGLRVSSLSHLGSLRPGGPGCPGRCGWPRGAARPGRAATGGAYLYVLQSENRQRHACPTASGSPGHRPLQKVSTHRGGSQMLALPIPRGLQFRRPRGCSRTDRLVMASTAGLVMDSFSPGREPPMPRT